MKLKKVSQLTMKSKHNKESLNNFLFKISHENFYHLVLFVAKKVNVSGSVAMEAAKTLGVVRQGRW